MATTAKSKEQDVENSAMGKFRMGRILGEKWQIVQKLDEGGFGSVYKVQNVKDPKSLAALKVEPASSDEWNHLKLETAVLKELHANGIRAHVPQLFRSAKRRSYCYMIITLLGENLRRLKDRLFPKGMPLRTWARVAVQCLYGLKTMHDRGYIHRDIKPQNFVLGYGATPAFARVVYVIDFGLARNYAFAPTAACRKWIARRARARLEFRGTYRYAAPSMHEEKEQGRKDDVWSWLYMMIDLYCGLPWLDSDTKNALEKKKLHMKDEDLMIRMPEEIKFIPKHLRSLNVYQRPDYLKIYRALETLRKASKTSYEDSYEWESKEEAANNKKAMSDKQAPVGYTNAEIFFRSDPIGLKSAPTAKEEQMITERFIVKKAKPEMVTLEDMIAISVKPKPKVSPEKKTTPPSTPKSREVVVVQKKQPARTISPASSAKKNDSASKHSKKKKRASKREGGSLEESDDFVPSCYMSFDIPLHYLQGQNEDARDFQKKVVGMDWGHVEPPKQVFKALQSPVQLPAAAQPSSEAVSTVQPALPTAAPSSQLQQVLQDQPSLLLLPAQQESSGGQSDDSKGPASNKSVGRESPLPQSPGENKSPGAISPTCAAACTIPQKDAIQDYPTAIGQPGKKPEPSSSNSSVSLGIPGCVTQQPRTKKSS